MSKHLQIKMSVIESNKELENSSWEIENIMNEKDEHVIYSRYLTEDDYTKIQPELITDCLTKALRKRNKHLIGGKP